jgi:hypothetical protein
MSISSKAQMSGVVGQSLHRISDALENKWGFQRVIIERHPESGRLTCRSERYLWEIIRDLFLWVFSCFAPAAWREENRKSIEFFYEVFGQKTISQIDADWGLGLEKKYENGASLSRRDVEILFAGLADVTMTRAQNLFDFCISEGAKDVAETPSNHEKSSRYEELLANTEVGLVQEMAKRALHARFVGKEFKDLTAQDWDEMWPFLVSFKEAKDIKLGRTDGAGNFITRHFRSAFNYFSYRVYLQHKLREANPQNQKMLWDLWFGKATLGKEGQKMGTIVPCYLNGKMEGVRRVSHELEGGGAAVLLLKAVTQTSGLFRSMIKFQSTRTTIFRRDTWLSWRDDLAKEMGRYGATAITPVMRYLAQRGDKPQGFEEMVIDGDLSEPFCGPEESFEVIGFSLGGAQAQLFTYLNPEYKVPCLVTICSPKIKERRARNFANKRIHEYPIVIKHYMEVDDPTDDFGQADLGAWCDPKKGKDVSLTIFSSDVTMTRSSVVTAILNPPSQSDKFCIAFFSALESFFVAHSRNTTLEEDGYACLRFSNSCPTDSKVMEVVLGQGLLENDLRIPVRNALQSALDAALATKHAAILQLRRGVSFWDGQSVAQVPLLGSVKQ